MTRMVQGWPHRLAACALIGVTLGAGTGSALARVTSITIDSTSPAFAGAPVGHVGAYETLTGRVFGELDPGDPHNAIIQDIRLAPRNRNGKASYVASFRVLRPVDASAASGLMVYEVANRGNTALPASAAAVTPGASYLESGWQGDLLAQCQTAYPCRALGATPFLGGSEVIEVPVARHPDGTRITGTSYGHIANATGSTAQLVIFSTPVPYKPSSPDTRDARFWSLAQQSITGVDGPRTPIDPGQWAWADCRTRPFPGTPDPTRICLKSGFDPSLLYEMTFTATDPLVLGVGYAATRDVISFFRNDTADGAGTPNPLAGTVRTVISAGTSQAASFLRSSTHLGFNQDERGRRVSDGLWSNIDGRQLYLNIRFALPDVITNLYMPADEAPVWWAPYPDLAHGHAPFGILSRCSRSGTCPEVLETFGSLEFYDEKMSPDLIGFTAIGDIPLPRTVHRYYLPSTTHGGGGGGFTFDPDPPAAAGCTLPANPNPESDTTNALFDDFVALLMRGEPMPPSAYPTLGNGGLVPATQAAEGFPRIPGFPFAGDRINHPELFAFGPRLDSRDQTGIIDQQPPAILRVLPALAPRVNADGNEPWGIPSVLLAAPLQTYVGWNLFASGIYRGQQCGLTASAFPFKETRAQRLAAADPRPSIEERYGTHAGYVCAVGTAARLSVAARLLRAVDAVTLRAQAASGNVLAGIAPQGEDQRRGAALCAAEATLP